MKRPAIIVLAAGRSTRFAGSNTHKLLAPLAGTTVVRRSVERAIDASVGEVIVVVGAEREAITAAISGLPARVVYAPRHAEGMAESLRAGVESVRASVDAVIIGLADQPTMRPEAYRRVTSVWANTDAAIVRPKYTPTDVPAHPTLFSWAVFGELLAIRGDAGAREVLTRDPSRVRVATIAWPAPRDIDTVDDLALVAAELDAESADEMS